MGLWSWLTGTKKRFSINDDTIWLNQQAKCRGLCDEIQKRLDESTLVLVVAYFCATLDQLKAEMGARGLPYLVHGGSLAPARLVSYESHHDPKARILLVLADDLMADEFPEPAVDAKPELPVLVAEHHFLRPLDEKILTFAATLDRRSRITFHLSLEDPLIHGFISQRMRDLLKNLGMQESRPIANHMIARGVKSAQAQLARRLIGDHKAASPQEWLKLNVADTNRSDGQ
jgi:hypothetical protein